MPTRFAKLVLAAIFSIASLSLAEPPAKSALVIGPPIADIPVVRTGKELLKVDSISENDQEFHAGIESNSCDLGGGALVYIVFPKPNKTFATPVTTSEEQSALGPFILEIEPQEKGELRKLQEEIRRLSQRDTRENQFFVGAIQPPRSGKYSIRIKSPAGAVLAKTEFTVTDKPAQSWLALASRGGANRQGNKKEIECTIGARPVCPQWNSESSIDFSQGDLPTMFPSVEAADFKIKIIDGAVEITGNGLTPIINDYYMARIWVNDKPVIIKKIMLEKESRDSLEELQRADPVTYKLRINFSQLDAKEGDNVTLQIAYCPAGTKLAVTGDVGMLREARAFRRSSADASLLLSKKITLKLTKESVAPIPLEKAEQANVEADVEEEVKDQ